MQTQVVIETALAEPGSPLLDARGAARLRSTHVLHSRRPEKIRTGTPASGDPRTDGIRDDAKASPAFRFGRSCWSRCSGSTWPCCCIVLTRAGAPRRDTACLRCVSESRGGRRLHTAGQQPAASAERFSPLDAAPVYAPEIPLDAQTAGAAQPAGGADRRGRQYRSSGDPREPCGVAGRRRRASAPGGTAAIRCSRMRTARPTRKYCRPSVRLNLTGREALPDLHLDVHVYRHETGRALRLHQYAQISGRGHACGRPGARAHPARRRDSQLSRSTIRTAAPAIAPLYHSP